VRSAYSSFIYYEFQPLRYIGLGDLLILLGFRHNVRGYGYGISTFGGLEQRRPGRKAEGVSKNLRI
jgi:hypothetical protein